MHALCAAGSRGGQPWSPKAKLPRALAAAPSLGDGAVSSAARCLPIVDAMNAKDQTLVCRLCGDDFVFSSGEQELQRVRGIDKAPTRCSVCRSRPPTMPLLPRLSRP